MLLGLPAGILGGLAPLVRFECRAARLVGLGLGPLPALRFLGNLALGVGDLLARFRLNRLYLCPG